MERNSKSTVPDGGWGWVIVFAVAFINMTNQSILSVFGQLFGGLFRQDTFVTALITNLNSLMLNTVSGIFVGPVIKAFKPRNITAFGCVLVSTGLVICSVATKSWHFIVGYSFFLGFGLGLISPSTFIVISSYFHNKRGRAVGVALAGAGIGQIVMPHIVRYCLDNYGFRQAALALASISISGLLGTIFLKPFCTQPTELTTPTHLKCLLNNETPNEKLDKLVNKPTAELKTQDGTGIFRKLGRRLAEAMDLSLLKDASFLSIIVGIALVYTTTINFTMIFPSFLQNSVGLTSITTAICMSIIASADITFRLILPCITDHLAIPYRVVFLLGTVGLLITRTLLAESSNFAVIFCVCIFTGLSKSATVINNNLVISAHCSQEMLPGGLGLNMIAKGMLVMTVGQFLGWMRDYTNSYTQCLLAQNVFLAFVVIVWTPELYFQFRRKKNTFNEVNDN